MYIYLNDENIIYATNITDLSSVETSNKIIKIDDSFSTQNILRLKWDVKNNKIDESYTPPTQEVQAESKNRAMSLNNEDVLLMFKTFTENQEKFGSELNQIKTHLGV